MTVNRYSRLYLCADGRTELMATLAGTDLSELTVSVLPNFLPGCGNKTCTGMCGLYNRAWQSADGPPERTEIRMLQVVETTSDGRVLSIERCSGIDAALSYVAGRLTHPEEDHATSYDVIDAQWSEYLDDDHGWQMSDVVFTRRGYNRFGLACES